MHLSPSYPKARATELETKLYTEEIEALSNNHTSLRRLQQPWLLLLVPAGLPGHSLVLRQGYQGLSQIFQEEM